MAIKIAIAVIVLLLLGAVYFTFFAGNKKPISTEQQSSAPKILTEAEELAQSNKKLENNRKKISATLKPLNNSNQSGKVAIEQIYLRPITEILLDKGPINVAQPAFIYKGSCDNRGQPLYPLINIKNGKSETTLEVSINTLMNQLPLSVVISKSNKELSNFVLCGDLKVE